MAVTDINPSAVSSPFLRGVYTPVFDELDAADLAVSGEIPPALTGSYLRNGANPQFAPTGEYHWFDGDGMIHAVDVADGRARYRNRWVVTPGLVHERAAGHALFGGILNFRFPPEELLAECGVFKNAANTNVVRHAGKTLALWEGGFPSELTADLDTVGLWDFDGRLTGAMTAHPKWCPETGEMIFFGYDPVAGPPFLRYHVADAAGALVHSAPITLPRGVMMHDFLTTRHHSLFFDLPAVLSMTGEGMWQPQHGARIGVVPRLGGDDDVRWFEIEPCFVFHFLNAWEEDDGDTIVAFGCRMPSVDLDFEKAKAAAGGAVPGGIGLTKWTIDLVGGTVREELLDDVRTDFPRLNDELLGLRHRYGHASAAIRNPLDLGFDAIVQYDLQTGDSETYSFGDGHVIGEAVMANDPDADAGSDERAGWLMVYDTNLATMTTDLAVLEAADITAGPVARIHLPQRVPSGFHGNWLPD
jgi:carotenoid cleavage dioxygenase-like enzyme